MFGQQKQQSSYDQSLQQSASLLDYFSASEDNGLTSTLPSSNSSSPLNTTPTIPNLFGGANPNPNPYLTSAAIVPDFNADGKTDKLWINAETGEIIVRLMDG